MYMYIERLFAIIHLFYFACKKWILFRGECSRRLILSKSDYFSVVFSPKSRSGSRGRLNSERREITFTNSKTVKPLKTEPMQTGFLRKPNELLGPENSVICSIQKNLAIPELQNDFSGHEPMKTEQLRKPNFLLGPEGFGSLGFYCIQDKVGANIYKSERKTVKTLTSVHH